MLKCDSLADPALINLLKTGAVGILPTDTVYGLVCQATNQTSVARLYKLKSRDHKPGTVIAADLQQLVDLGLKRRYLTAVNQYWPNALSIVIPCSQELEYLHLGMNGLAVRIPADKIIHEFLLKVGPLLTSSANLPGENVSPTINAAMDYFGQNVDFYVDGGDLSHLPPSTIIRIIDDAMVVLRQGAVKINPDTGEIQK